MNFLSLLDNMLPEVIAIISIICTLIIAYITAKHSDDKQKAYSRIRGLLVVTIIILVFLFVSKNMFIQTEALPDSRQTAKNGPNQPEVTAMIITTQPRPTSASAFNQWNNNSESSQNNSDDQQNSIVVNTKRWPSMGYSLHSINPVASGDKRIQSYCGPGTSYHGAGAYKANKITRVDGILIEGSYILVDMDYSTVGKRRVYFKCSAFRSTNNVQEVNLPLYEAQTTSSVTARYGPGADYDTFNEADLSSGDSLMVIFEENGYVFAEFDSPIGTVRGWINESNVKPK